MQQLLTQRTVWQKLSVSDTNSYFYKHTKHKVRMRESNSPENTQNAQNTLQAKAF